MEDGSAEDGHRYFEDLAVSHVVGGLDDSDGRVFRAHLLECPDCRARVWELRALAHDLADVERDERRTRAAQALETKQREEDDGSEAPPAQSSRGDSRTPRAVLLVSLAVILTMAAWMFTMRGTIARQEQVIADLDAAVTVMESGTEADVIQTGAGVEGSLRVEGSRGVLLVHGIADHQPFGIYFLNGAGEVIHNRAEMSTDGQLSLLMGIEPGTATLVVTQLERGPTPSPTGTRVFEAALPTD